MCVGARAGWVVAQFVDDEYAGDTYRKVTLTAASLKDSEGTTITDNVADLFGANEVQCNPVTTTDEDDKETTTYSKCATYTLAVNLDAGEYTIAATGVDSAGNTKSGNATFTVTARKPFGLSLKPGVNLVSIPGNPVGDGGGLNVMFEDHSGVSLVTTYDRGRDVAGENPWLRSTRDPETGLFTGDIAALEPGMAYFITSDASVTVNVLLQDLVGQIPPTIQVRYGYNAIGYQSLSGTPEKADLDGYLEGVPWTVAYTYDPTPGNGWTAHRPDDGLGDNAMDGRAVPGMGYLVFSRFDATLTP